ncbi:MAG: phage head morphogenesis protein [Ruminococcus sp.]|nr:phage head morphogenesis protein [Ruminococcus sp.]
MCQYCDPLIKAIDAYLTKANNDLTDSLKSAGFVKPKDTVKEIESFEDETTEALEDEVTYYRKKASKAVDLKALKKIWPKIVEGDTTDKTLTKLFAEDFEKNIPKLATTYIKQVDPQLTVSTITARTTVWASDWSGKLAELMKLDTQTEIEKLLTDTLKEGKSVADFTQALIDGEIRSERYRARSAALAETLRAHSVAQQEAITQNPAVESKEWVHTGEYRNSSRENHVAMNGVIVPKDEPFTLGGADGETYYLMYPRDPSLPPGESVNCHCIHRGIVNEDILGLSLEERKRLQQEAIDADDGA